PHMTLAKNIAFGLPKDRHGEIESWLARVGLAGLGERYPHQLSGGQQQRAALARAMAPEPQVLLMDEPFASVDIVLRRSLRRECRMLLRERAATTILVTLADGRSFHAVRAGEDTSRGLALVKVDADDLPVPEFVAPQAVRVGSWTFALGRTFGRRSPSVHMGVISAVG
ncbi:MAG: ATP-binding cassette domain-containing protein, partial [Pseudomonadota bacterium]